MPAELKGKKFDKPVAESKPGSKRMEIGEVSLKLGAKKSW